MRRDLVISNPSPYPRSGIVVVPWHQVGTEPNSDDLVLTDASGRELSFQIDNLPDSPVLVFELASQIQPHSATTVALTKGSSKASASVEVGYSYREPDSNGTRGRIELWNDRLFVSMSLSPSQDADGGHGWFAGSAQSVRLYGREMLEPFAFGWEHHSPNKRCMQVDKLDIGTDSQQVRLFDQPFQFLPPASLGPVRVVVVITSAPFQYEDSASGKAEPCRLQRIVSLCRGAQHIEELLTVRKDVAGHDPQGSGPFAAGIQFCAHYFTHVDMGIVPKIVHEVSDWFVIGCPDRSFPCYGFATDAHVLDLEHPASDTEPLEHQHQTYSWQLGSCRFARVLHLFLRDERDFDHVCGHAWYEHLFEPPGAQVAASAAG